MEDENGTKRAGYILEGLTTSDTRINHQLPTASLLIMHGGYEGSHTSRRLVLYFAING